MENRPTLYEELYTSAQNGWHEAGYWKGRYQVSKAFGIIGAGILLYELYNGYTKWKEDKEKNDDDF